MSHLDYKADPNDGTPDQRLIYDLWHEWNFCGCANPEDVLAMVRDRLAEKRAYWGAPGDLGRDFPEHNPDFYASTASALLLEYVLDAADLTEHGGNVSGAWLTEKGAEVLAVLERNDIDGLVEAWNRIGVVAR